MPCPTPPTSSIVTIPSAPPSEPRSPSALSPPPVLLAELSKVEVKKVQLQARNHIYRLMIVEEVVPTDEEWDKKIAQAISVAIQSVIGSSAVVQLPSLQKNTIGAMAAMHQAFKQYAFCHIHKEFGLHQESGSEGSEIQHQATRVREDRKSVV